MYHITGIDHMDSTNANETHDHGEEDDLGEEHDRGEEYGNDTLNEENLFQRRFEEGYDIFHKPYVRWLMVHHPEQMAQ